MNTSTTTLPAIVSDVQDINLCDMPGIKNFVNSGTWDDADRMSKNIYQCAIDITSRSEFLVAERNTPSTELERMFNAEFGELKSVHTEYIPLRVTTNPVIFVRTIINFVDADYEPVAIKPGAVEKLAVISPVNPRNIREWLATIDVASRDKPDFWPDESWRSKPFQAPEDNSIIILNRPMILYCSWWADICSGDDANLREIIRRINDRYSDIYLRDDLPAASKLKAMAYEANKLGQELCISMPRPE